MAITELSLCGPDGDELCRLGMQGPGGGYVFFIDHDDLFPSFCATGDCNYLEFAPTDAANKVAWCSNTSSLGLDGWDKRAIGEGRTNTARMLDTSASPHCTSGAAVEAAAYAVSGGAGAGEWWLPSLAELMVLFRVANEFGVGGFDPLERAWSSSEAALGTPSAWALFTREGYVQAVTKGTAYRVRAIRAF